MKADSLHSESLHFRWKPNEHKLAKGGKTEPSFTRNLEVWLGVPVPSDAGGAQSQQSQEAGPAPWVWSGVQRQGLPAWGGAWTGGGGLVPQPVPAGASSAAESLREVTGACLLCSLGCGWKETQDAVPGARASEPARGACLPFISSPPSSQ